MAEKPRKVNFLLLTFYFLLFTSYEREAVLVTGEQLTINNYSFPGFMITD